MKLSIATSLLQTMVAKSMKGASCNRMIPITNLLSIELKDNVLELITSDATNYLYVREENIIGDDFYVVVQADIFSKLIARMTCDKITMELKSNMLKVFGNGEYSIELPLDENGELIRYPDPVKSADTKTNPYTVNLSTIRLILSTAKVSLATTMEVPCYTGYYVGDKIVATDTCQMCGISIKMFDRPVLISPETLNLLDVFDEEKITVYITGNTIVFKSSHCVVYGTLMDCIDDYQIDAVNGLLDEDFPSSCALSKNEMLQLLDRLALFVDVYDKNGIYLTFTRDGLVFNSKRANSSELVQYIASSDFADFTCCIDIEMFRSQIKATSNDTIELHYGKDNAIKLTDGNITQILALLEDDRI